MDAITIGLWILMGIIWAGLIIGWIYTLYQEAKKKHPIWFIFTLLIPIVAVIYWVVKGLK